MSLRNAKLPTLNDKLHALRDESVAVESEIKATEKAKGRAVKDKKVREEN